MSPRLPLSVRLSMFMMLFPFFLGHLVQLSNLSDLSFGAHLLNIKSGYDSSVVRDIGSRSYCKESCGLCNIT